MDEAEVTEEPKEEKIGYHGIGSSPEHETLIGIYQCAYGIECSLEELATFFRAIFFLLIGSIIVVAFAQLLDLIMNPVR